MKTLVDYALSHCGIPYRWGGDDPLAGYDCSGVLQEILASVGADPKGDQTADGLYRYFKSRGFRGLRQSGSLCFFGTETRITHCGFAIDSYRMVEAGGGGSRTKTEADAAKQNAYIRVRPIEARRDLIEIILPRYKNVIM